ncbi:MAG: sulfite exporter TauE/SafE family protein [Nanoarchaeota archaeon]|nr:sulfite exporter TauE/SafE family protein [Nanoarchaeota archaeon]
MGLMQFMEIMGTSNIPVIAAFFIGLMTAISPCPLATNITAIAYVSKKIDNNRHTFLVGIFYTLGRMSTYVIISSLIVWFGIKTQAISYILNNYGEKLLGPLLFGIGIVMLDIINLKFFKGNNKINNFTEKLSENLSNKGLFGSFMLGVVFALAFCPFSGVLFFGMLIPLALFAGDPLIIPASFALATGLPVIIFSLILTFSLSKIGLIMNKLQVFEKWTRRIAAIIFVVVGIYYSLKFFL